MLIYITKTLTTKTTTTNAMTTKTATMKTTTRKTMTTKTTKTTTITKKTTTTKQTRADDGDDNNDGDDNDDGDLARHRALMIGVANPARHRDQYNPDSASVVKEYQTHFERIRRTSYIHIHGLMLIPLIISF